MLSISSIYGHGFDSPLVSRLEALGFRTRAQMSRYMGAQLLRFIDFERGPCLEMIEVEDERAYLDFVPYGMRAYAPGISLVLSQGETIRDYEREFQHLHPYGLHVNYDGSPGSLGPGWNYLNFGIPLVADTFIWLTTHDEPRPEREYISSHPNAVKGMEGIVFDLGVDSLAELRQLVKGESTDGAFRIGDLGVWPRDTLDGLIQGHDKVFPLAAIILRAENLDYFMAFPKQVKPCTFMSHSAVHIATNRQSWDLVVIA